MTLPELASENPTVYFPISEGRNKLYNIKSFSLRIEDEVIINTNLLKLDWPERTEPRFSVCADRLYDDLMEYPKVLKIPINDTFILNRDPDNKRLLMDYLLAMCVAINKDKVLQSYRNAPLKVHQVALIHRDNRWLLMNDDKSVVIHDIVQFSKHLIGDNIYTVVLEEGEQDKITTTTITTTTTTTIKNDPSGDATTTNNNGLVKDLEKLQLS
ncbi:hypothetical protein SNEBB_001058 [Seison nebaliae]|nr:hypothetical protein SNEBB_001058 [Seison nebaliae]